MFVTISLCFFFCFVFFFILFVFCNLTVHAINTCYLFWYRSIILACLSLSYIPCWNFSLILRPLWFVSGVCLCVCNSSILSASAHFCFWVFPFLFTISLLPNSVWVFSRSMCLDQSSMECCVSNVSCYIGQDFFFFFSHSFFIILLFLCSDFSLHFVILLIFMMYEHRGFFSQNACPSLTLCL